MIKRNNAILIENEKLKAENEYLKDKYYEMKNLHDGIITDLREDRKALITSRCPSVMKNASRAAGSTASPS